MIKLGKHLLAKKLESNRFQIENTKGLVLGVIVYNTPWRRYVYEPKIDTYYSSSCMIPIGEFLKNLDRGKY